MHPQDFKGGSAESTEVCCIQRRMRQCQARNRMSMVLSSPDLRRKGLASDLLFVPG
jgi:hypothetical protein